MENSTLNKLDKWIRVIQKSTLVLAGVEAAIVLVIGVASNNITGDSFSNFWLTTLVFLGIIYIIITIIKIAYNQAFPVAIVEELISKQELEKSKSLIDRKDAINNYIASTIISLSNCECTIPKQKENSDWKKASDEDFTKGINSLLKNFNNVLNILLNTTNHQFSTCIYVEKFRAIDNDNSPKSNEGLFFLRDDFTLSNANLRDLVDQRKTDGTELEIQNLIKVSLNNGRFESKKIKIKNESEILIICANIEHLKNDNQKGVLVIITRPIKQLPEDIKSVLRMFTNIISHWIDLYEHEVVQQQIRNLAHDEEE